MVREGLWGTSAKKAIGPDEIPAEVWMAMPDEVIQAIADAFNKELDGEGDPGSWGRVAVTLIPKLKSTDGG
eukprot:9864375-Alexandrium_andersonii.AAC.1